jgi:hypothetical protein
MSAHADLQFAVVLVSNRIELLLMSVTEYSSRDHRVEGLDVSGVRIEE